MEFKYDIIVVGAGHAGCEAASAAARMGSKTLLITMDMNKIGQMSCNPAVGGIAKGQIVREIDAMGGQMGIVTDRSAIQFRMLNRSKGPAMWSPRSQSDRKRFIEEWVNILTDTPNLDIWQDTVVELVIKDGEVKGASGQEITANILGVVVKDKYISSNGTEAVHIYREGDNVTILNAGNIFIEVEAEATQGQYVHLVKATGALSFDDEIDTTGDKVYTKFRVSVGNADPYDTDGIIEITTANA